MNTLTIIVGGILGLLFSGFIIFLFYTIMKNLINGRKFHHSLEQQFNKLRLSNMLAALGINKTRYLYQTRVQDIQQQMDNCSNCENIDECDERLSDSDLDISTIDFCNNEAELIEIKQQQIRKQSENDQAESDR
ncbi:MAG TPA: hypothetical protein ENJ87_00470 [Gammaproteobacteria bacterium]|nr:hypothetical protein [Gammaproteobacteria bacterium]